jgi:Zn-dependent membrane protease YugP
MWHDVKHPRHPGRLLMRYDPERRLIQIAEKGEKHVIDLSEYDLGGHCVGANIKEVVEYTAGGLDKSSGVE